MRIGLFGGTFHPIHNGHLHLCEELKKQAHLDQIWLVPVYEPPHKERQDLLSGEERVRLCQLAVEDLPGFSVCPIEVERRGKSYTIDTLRALKSCFPGNEWVLMVGSDMYLTLRQWKDSEELLHSCEVITAAREEKTRERLCLYRDCLRREGVRTEVYEIQVLPLSSTQVRKWIKEGKDVSAYLPPKVAQYIAAHRLYQK